MKDDDDEISLSLSPCSRMRELLVKACESSLWDCVSVSKNKNL
jgi:hypothetical protein